VHWIPVGAALTPRALRQVTFRRAAASALQALELDVTVSYGAECPPGDIQVVGSLHAAWLRRASPAVVRGYTVPGWIRRVAPQHIVRLYLERSYFRSPPIALVPCAQAVADDIRSVYGLIAERTIVIPNGFDPNQFSPDRRWQLRERIRSNLGYTSEQIVILMVANEWQRKGLAVLLDALHLLDRADLRLLLVGRRDPSAFSQRMRRLGLEEAVHYMGSSNDVAEAHAAADVFVLPTQYEAFALSIVEALASGLPTLTTDVPGAGDLISSGKNGLLLRDPYDADGLAELLSDMLDPDVLEQLSGEAPHSVANYTWERLMTEFENVVVDVV